MNHKGVSEIIAAWMRNALADPPTKLHFEAAVQTSKGRIRLKDLRSTLKTADEMRHRSFVGLSLVRLFLGL